MIGRGHFRAGYGASPLHLISLLACFALTGAAVVGWFQRPHDVETVLEWFVAAILLHDLVALPIYSLVDRLACGAVNRAVRQTPPAALPRLVNPTPYLRIPALLSGLLFVVFIPVLFGFGAGSELSASGIAESGYLARWLLATGVMFALSGAAYAVTAARARAARQPPRPAKPPRSAKPPPPPAAPPKTPEPPVR